MYDEDVLEIIKDTRNYFMEWCKEQDDNDQKHNIEQIVNVLSEIINENSDELAHKNIGTKINRFNRKKYVSCQDKINRILPIVDSTERMKGSIKVLLYNVKLDSIYKIQENVRHKLLTYNNKNYNYKDKYNV